MSPLRVLSDNLLRGFFSFFFFFFKQISFRSTLVFLTRVFSYLMTDLRMVQPGRFVSSALKYAGRKRRVGAHYSGNLGQITSVVTSRRVYNLEFTNYSDLKTFYSMIEAIFGVNMLSV